jgi:FeS assembly SUF system protein
MSWRKRSKKRASFLRKGKVMEETSLALSDKAPILDEKIGDMVNAATTIPQDELQRMTEDIIASLKTVYDPEIPADIYELGLIYKIDIEDDRSVAIDMTLTAPGCPVAGEMPGWVENAVGTVGGVSGVTVNMTFDPPWTAARMSEEAQIAVGWY